MRTTLRTLILAPAIVFAAACSKDQPADTSLTNDLTLAAQARQTATLDSISAVERTKAEAAVAARTAPPTMRAAAPAPTHHPTASTTRRRTTSSGHASSGGGGTYGTRSGTVASEGREVTVKNTKRDAAIGAVAGGIIGAATSRDKVKGGLIGAAAGGIIGGVIGNNVDIQKKRVP